MCLAMPMEVIEVNGDRATVDMSGVRREISIQTLSKTPDVGDFVIVHAGFAIEVMNEKSAKETIDLFSEVDEAQRQLSN